MSDGIIKNWDVVRAQWDDYKAECRDIKSNIESTDSIPRKLHYASAYLEEAIDKMSRLWFYTWLPKWALVVWLIL